MRIETFVAEALGGASHVPIDHGVAAVFDPQRDVRPYLSAIERAGASLAFVFETHVHNDYLSGGRELVERGATLVAPAESHLEFPHRPMADGEGVEVGGTRVAAFAAPGHTYEHAAYLATPGGGGAPTAAFTGGSLLMGSAGRSDLLGPDPAEDLARKQWDTAHRLVGALSRDAMLYPTHGAGSFCSSAGGVTDRFGALAVEGRRNPALSLPNVETFTRVHLARAPTPGYYRYMAPINRAGPRVFGAVPEPARLHPREAKAALVLDIRSPAAHAAAALPGSLLIEFGTSMLAYVGWLVPFGTPLALIAPDEALARIATVDLFRIGYEDVAGYALPSDFEPGELVSSGVTTAEEIVQVLRTGDRPVLDVRFRHEQEEGPVAGVIRAPIDELPAIAATLPSEPVLVFCESGYRASMAASFLRRLGRKATPLLGGGVADLRPFLAATVS